MIRGLIILFSLVVLTLQQSSCTCNSGSTIAADGEGSFPLSFQNVVDLTVQPDTSVATSWVTEFSGQFDTVAKAQAYFSSLDTATLSQKVSDADALNVTAYERVANITAIKTKFQNEIAIIKAKWDTFWGRVDKLVSQKDDPKACAQIVIDIWALHSRVRYLARLEAWINVTENAAISLAQVTSDRLAVLQTQLGISASIDTQMQTCSCSRVLATATVLASIPSNLITQVTNLVSAANTYITDTTASIQANLAVFADRTTEDDQDDADADFLYQNWANYENKIYNTYEQIVTVMNGIVAYKKSSIITRINAALQGDYKITNPDISCTTTSDNTTCTYTGIISGSADLAAGANYLIYYTKTVAVAFTGALHCDAVGTYTAATGAFSVSITFVKVNIDILLTGLDDDVVKANNVISDIVITAKADSDSYTAKATDVAADVQTALTAEQQKLSDSVTATTSAAVDVQTSFDARIAAAYSFQATQDATVAALVSGTSNWKAGFSSWDSSSTKLNDDNECCVTAIQKNIYQAQADVSAAVTDYYSVKLDYLNNPSDDSKKQYWIGAQASLQAKVQATCTTRDQLQICHDSLNKSVTDAKASYATDKAYLQAKSDALDQGTESTLDQIQADWKAKTDKISELLKKTIIGFYASIRDVICTYENVDGAQGSAYIKVHFTIVDDGSLNETAAAMSARHILCIQAAVTLCSQNKGFVVAAAGSVKRQGGSNQYVATAGTAPPVDPVAPGTPIAPGTPTATPSPSGGTTQPSGANTLVMSLVWAIVVSLLVLF